MHKNTTYHSSNNLDNLAKIRRHLQSSATFERHYILKHLHDYFPYGKTLREWYASNEETERFQTTHHQRDPETTLDHRGARFYDGDVGRFLSLDPLAADFPSWSDYNYVLGNPIRLVDRDGRSPGEPKTESFYFYVEVETPDGAISTHEQNISFTFNEENRNWEFNAGASTLTGNGTDDTEDGAPTLDVTVSESTNDSKKGESYFSIDINVSVTPEQETSNYRNTKGGSQTTGSSDEGGGEVGWGIGKGKYSHKEQDSKTDSESNFKGGSSSNSKSWNVNMTLNCKSRCENGTINLYTKSSSPNIRTSRGGYTMRTNLNGKNYGRGSPGLDSRAGKLSNSPMTRQDEKPIATTKMR